MSRKKTYEFPGYRTIDATCGDRSHSGTDVYVMLGKCTNCGDEPFAIVYTRGHDTQRVGCPTCGSHGIAFGGVTPISLMTVDLLKIEEGAGM